MYGFTTVVRKSGKPRCAVGTSKTNVSQLTANMLKGPSPLCISGRQRKANGRNGAHFLTISTSLKHLDIDAKKNTSMYAQLRF